MGGAGSGKSHFAVQKCMYRISKESGHRILMVRKVQNKLRESCFALCELLAGVDHMDCYDDFTWNRSTLKIKHKETGSEIIMIGIDDQEKVKSIAGITSIFVEEATELAEEDLDQLSLRLRSKTGHYNQIIMAWNPIDIGHWLYERFGKEATRPESAVLRVTTYKDNPHLPESYTNFLESLKQTNRNKYNVYALAHWGVSDRNKLFAYSFDYDKHVKPSVPVIDGIELILSFDFNIDPITCTAWQSYYDDDGSVIINCVREWSLREADIYTLAQNIASWIGNYPVLVTGDAAGRARHTLSKGLVGHYKIIQDLLGISPYQVQTPNSNPSISFTRVLLNSVLNNAKVTISQDGCPELIKDLQSVTVDGSGKVDKKKWEELGRNHLLDTFRYYCATYHADMVRAEEAMIERFKDKPKFLQEGGWQLHQ